MKLTNVSTIPAARPSVALTAMIMAQGLAATAWGEPTSSAQSEGATQLDPVVVSDSKTRQVASVKFTAPLRDTPQTVVAIPSEVFLQQGATNLSDVLRNTSGITFAAGEGGNAAATSGDSFYLRGFDTSNNIFVDGVRDVGAYSRDVYNWEQVDVVKGPAGADIGRGGAAGYVNATTKMPRLEEFVSGATSFGVDEQSSGSRRRSTVDIDQVLEKSPIPGTAVRLNAMGQDSDAVGREYAHSRSWAVAPSVALGLGTATRALLAYEHTEQDNLPDYGLPTPLLPGYASPAPVPAVDPATYFGFTADSDNVTADAVTARLEHDWNDLRISNQIRYSRVHREAIVTTPGQNGTAYTPATALLVRPRQGNQRDTSIVSNQTNLSAHFLTGEWKHSVSAGLEFSRETAYSPVFTSVTLPPIRIDESDPTSAPALAPFRSGASSDVVTKTAALYAFDTVEFSRRWQANASVRAERYHTHFVGLAPDVAATILDATHSLVSWKGGLVFKPARAGSLYAAYAIALTPPGSDFTLSSAAGNQNNPDTAPQRSSNIELGVKWDFNGGLLSTNAAVFKTVNDKTVFTDPILGPVPTGRQTVEGCELGATRRLTDNWIILANVSFLHSEINSGTTAGGNLAGSPLPLIPRWSGNLFTSYRFHSGLLIGGGGQYSSEVSRRDNNTPAVPRTSPSYWLFNAVVSYPVARHVTVQLNVNNLLDRRFVQSINNNGARFNPGAPRSYLLTAEFRF